MPFDPISYYLAKKKGITWEEVKSKLETEGAKNKQYDSDLDAIIDLAAIPDTLTGKDADSVDGHHAGTGADNVLVLDSDGLVPLANIPVLDWTKLQFPGVRQEILAKFSDPKILIATSSMLLLLNSAEKVEAASGNISATSQDLEIAGGTSTKEGRSWIYWNLPKTTTRVYVRLFLADEGNALWGGAIQLCDDDGSTFANPPDMYNLGLQVARSAEDFLLQKNVGGTWTDLVKESVDLTANQFYDIELYFEGDGAGKNCLKAWRDGVLKFDYSDTETEIPSIASVRIMCSDNSTTTTEIIHIRGAFIVIYE